MRGGAGAGTGAGCCSCCSDGAADDGQSSSRGLRAAVSDGGGAGGGVVRLDTRPTDAPLAALAAGNRGVAITIEDGKMEGGTADGTTPDAGIGMPSAPTCPRPRHAAGALAEAVLAVPAVPGPLQQRRRGMIPVAAGVTAAGRVPGAPLGARASHRQDVVQVVQDAVSATKGVGGGRHVCGADVTPL